jgi:hypothetical protein
MRLTKTVVAVEIAAVLVVLVVVEWLAHVLTNTRNMFAPAVLTVGVYLAVRAAISVKNRRTGESSNST